MRLSGGSHLTYCTNIHPGESWPQVRAALGRHLPAVKRRAAPDRDFGVGLRLSDRAARELEAPGAFEEFSAFLAEEGLYVFTVNGFPFGAFHGRRVKEAVYEPDWSDRRRLDYSDRLASILARLMPVGGFGTVSTVPVGHRRMAATPDAVAMAGRLLREHAAKLHRLKEATGRTIVLALEPEPDCLLETTSDVIAFYEDTLLRSVARGAEEEIIRRHIGVCLDTCHAAVVFENPDEAMGRLEGSGIGIAKVQISNALRIEAMNGAAAERLRAFADDIYLHQVVTRRGGRLGRFPDLPPALAADGQEGAEWRVHFHVPVWAETISPFGSTQSFARNLLDRHRRLPVSRHLEVETYSWALLPEEHRGRDLDDDIARELLWVLNALG